VIQLLSLIGFLAATALCVMGLEYVLVFLYPELIIRGDISPYLVLFLRKLALPARAGGPLLYWLFFLFLSLDPTMSKRGKWGDKQSISKDLISVLCFGLSWLGLFSIGGIAPNESLLILYPLLVLVILIAGPFCAKALALRPARWGIANPKRRQRSKFGFFFRISRGWINIADPFRGILVIGAAGSGKSYSLAEPILYQAAKQSYCGILYDFKFPVLTETAYTAYHHSPKNITFYVLNFMDLTRSHRVNPLKPENLPLMAYAEEYAQTIMSNLMPETIEKKDFWIRSATAILTATIWHIKRYHPTFCTLPHIVALICNKHFEKLLPRLEADPETQGLIASFATALEKDANKQLAGILASVQIALSRIHTPQIAWVISGNDFNLDLNDPKDLKFLSIGSDASLSESLAPVISSFISAALKKLNKPGQHHSLA